jgi:predicted transcriptional regulator YdeE
MSPELTTISAFSVTGLKARTTNAAEQNPATGRIGPLWGQFYSSSLASQGSIYGVYSNYESDMHGAFDITAGVGGALVESANQGWQTLQVKAGDYLVFRHKGAMPQAVIDCWIQIWQYFSQPRSDVQRRYATDFEQYLGSDEVAIHIGVKKLS